MSWKYTILAFLLLTCFTSCEEDLGVPNEGKGDGTIRIIASHPAGYKQTRAADELDKFIDQTKFYIYATKTTASGEDWNINYMLKNPNPDPSVQDALAVGVADASEMLGNAVRIRPYTNSADPEKAELYSIAQKFNDKPMNLYGIVAASNSQEERESLETEFSRSQYTFVRSDNKPAALFMSYYARDDEGNYLPTHKPLPDFMWSGTVKNIVPYNNSGDIIMPFYHVLSKLRFHAIYMDDKTAERQDITITGLRLEDYAVGLLPFDDGIFNYNYDDNNPDMDRTEWIDLPMPEGGVIPSEKSDGLLSPDENGQYRLSDPFCITRVFPTYNTSYDNTFDKDLTDNVPGVPVGDLKEGDITDGQAVDIEVTYTMGGTKKVLSVPLKTGDSNFAFAPNHEYDIVLTFTTTSVLVTIIPLYYDYIDEDIPLEDYELGEPIDFGGVLWAASNLGATSTDPLESAESWEKARGFYYQYGRNIPYYVRSSVLDPYPYIANSNDGRPSNISNKTWRWDYENARTLYTSSNPNYNSDKTKNIYIPYGPPANYACVEGHGSRAYPYIPILWEKEIKDAGGNIETGYKNFLRKYRFYSPKVANDQTAPAKNFSDPYIGKYIAENPTKYPPNSVAYTAYYPGGEAYFSGRYWNQKYGTPKNWYDAGGNNESDPCPKGWRLPRMKEFYSIFPYNQKCGDISFNRDSDGPGHPGDVSVYRETVLKDYNDRRAVYVGILNDGEGYSDFGKNKYGEEEHWGSVYAIKDQFSAGAYAIRWRIKIVGYKDGGQSEAGINTVDPDETDAHLGRGVLVIDKYELSGDDTEKWSLNYRKPKSGEAEYTKGAEYKCIAFVDTDEDNVKDAGETTERKIDWEHPDGTLYLPVTGYIIMPGSGGQALLYPGREGLYWTADGGTHNTTVTNGKAAGVAVRIKFSGDYLSRYLYYTSEEYVANGCNIRPVRDTRAEIQ